MSTFVVGGEVLWGGEMERIYKIGVLILDKIFCYYTLYIFKNHQSPTSKRLSVKESNDKDD